MVLKGSLYGPSQALAFLLSRESLSSARAMHISGLDLDHDLQIFFLFTRHTKFKSS